MPLARIGLGLCHAIRQYLALSQRRSVRIPTVFCHMVVYAVRDHRDIKLATHKEETLSVDITSRVSRWAVNVNIKVVPIAA